MSIDFDQLISRLGQRLQEPLPGAVAHEPMRAVPVGAVVPRFEHAAPPRPGSVLILLYPHHGQICFPLTKRPEYAGTHSGQISLPGGKAEPGETTIQTALREGEEEIGVRSSDVQILGTLTRFFVIPSNFEVVPVVGYLKARPIFLPDPIEVVRILEGSLEAILRADAVQEREILAARTFPLRAPHFLIEDEIVWGATAMMLNEFRQVVAEVL
jgi:8-oxo-dGTP pyrophosphatase MutT (NUDIX family)